MLATVSITWEDQSTWVIGDILTSNGDEPLFHAFGKLREQFSDQDIELIREQIRTKYGDGKFLSLTTAAPWRATHRGVELVIVAR